MGSVVEDLKSLQERQRRPVLGESEIELARSAITKLNADSDAVITEDEKSAIIKAHSEEAINVYAFPNYRRVVQLIADTTRDRHRAEVLAKQKARQLKADAVDVGRPKNLIETIHDSRDKALNLSVPIPTLAAITRTRPYLEEFFRQLAEHTGKKVDLSPRGGYLEVVGDSFIGKFSIDPIRGGGFWLSNWATPVTGSNVIMAYIYFFWGSEKIRLAGIKNGSVTKIETDSYTLRIATRDILLWCDEMANGYVPPVRSVDEELDEIAGVTDEVLFPDNNSKPITVSPLKLRTQIKNTCLSIGVSEETLRRVYPQLFSASKFLRLLRYWESRNDLPFTVTVMTFSNNTYRVRISPV